MTHNQSVQPTRIRGAAEFQRYVLKEKELHFHC